MMSTPALVLALLAPSFLQGSSADGAPLAHLLRRQERDARPRSQLVEQLVALGPDRIPTWLDWVEGRGLDALFLSEPGFRASDWMVLPEDAPALAREVLGRLGPDVVEHLERRLTRAANAERPVATAVLGGFSVLEEVGSSRGLALLWRLVADLGRDVFLPRYREAAVAALAAMLARDDASWRQVALRLREPDDTEIELLLAAFRRTGRAEAQPLVLDLLELSRTSSEITDVLETLAAMERDFPWTFAGQTVRVARRYWLGLEFDDRLTVAGLLGHSEDHEAVDLLLELLENPDPRASVVAETALRNLGGVSYGRDVDVWRRWQEREALWWQRDGGALLAALEGELAPAVAALEVLGRHPLYRREVAQEISASLIELWPEVQERASETLVVLGSRAALPALIELEEQLRGQSPERAASLRKRISDLAGQSSSALTDGVQ